MTFWTWLMSLLRPAPKPKRRYNRLVCPECLDDFAVTKAGKPVHPHRCKGPGGAA